MHVSAWQPHCGCPSGRQRRKPGPAFSASSFHPGASSLQLPLLVNPFLSSTMTPLVYSMWLGDMELVALDSCVVYKLS